MRNQSEEVILPQVRDYLDYRKYLKDFFDAKKTLSSDYSHRVFARQAGINSPSHLKMVIDGKRNLTHNMATRYKKALGFTKKKEGEYFDLLIYYNQETDHDLKMEFFQNLLKEKERKGLSLLAREQFNFLSQWHYVAIYVLVDIEGFRADADWIGARLRKKVSKMNIEKAINDLIKIGLLEYDSGKGLKQARGALDTPEEIQSMAVIPYHRNMITLALNYLDDGDWRKREFNGGTLPMNEKTLGLLKEKIREFRREVNEMTDSVESASDVYQFNLQLFPLTESSYDQ